MYILIYIKIPMDTAGDNEFRKSASLSTCVFQCLPDGTAYWINGVMKMKIIRCNMSCHCRVPRMWPTVCELMRGKVDGRIDVDV